MRKQFDLVSKFQRLNGLALALFFSMDANAGTLTREEFLQTLQNDFKPFAARVLNSLGFEFVLSAIPSEQEMIGKTYLEGNRVVIAISNAHWVGPTHRREALLTIACNELGHHLGARGFSAAEGESDYYAAHACLRSYFSTEPSLNEKSYLEDSPEARDLCSKTWKTTQDIGICMRTVLGSLSLRTGEAKLLKYLGLLSPETPMPQLGTPDQRVVRSTGSSHPEPQCRLDTAIAGALCAVPFRSDRVAKSIEEIAATSCVEGRDPIGSRPKCWFFKY